MCSISVAMFLALHAQAHATDLIVNHTDRFVDQVMNRALKPWPSENVTLATSGRFRGSRPLTFSARPSLFQFPSLHFLALRSPMSVYRRLLFAPSSHRPYPFVWNAAPRQQFQQDPAKECAHIDHDGSREQAQSTYNQDRLKGGNHFVHHEQADGEASNMYMRAVHERNDPVADADWSSQQARNLQVEAQHDGSGNFAGVDTGYRQPRERYEQVRSMYEQTRHNGGGFSVGQDRHNDESWNGAPAWRHGANFFIGYGKVDEANDVTRNMYELAQQTGESYITRYEGDREQSQNTQKQTWKGYDQVWPAGDDTHGMHGRPNESIGNIYANAQNIYKQAGFFGDNVLADIAYNHANARRYEEAKYAYEQNRRNVDLVHFVSKYNRGNGESRNTNVQSQNHYDQARDPQDADAYDQASLEHSQDEYKQARNAMRYEQVRDEYEQGQRKNWPPRLAVFKIVALLCLLFFLQGPKPLLTVYALLFFVIVMMIGTRP